MRIGTGVFREAIKAIEPNRVGEEYAVEGAIEAIADASTKRVAQIEWEYAQEVRRDWPLLNQMATQMGITQEQLDALFIQAATL